MAGHPYKNVALPHSCPVKGWLALSLYRSVLVRPGGNILVALSCSICYLDVCAANAAM